MDFSNKKTLNRENHNKLCESRPKFNFVIELKTLNMATTVGIRLSALQLPGKSSYWTFSSSLTEWSYNELFVRYSGHHSVNGLKVQ